MGSRGNFISKNFRRKKFDTWSSQVQIPLKEPTLKFHNLEKKFIYNPQLHVGHSNFKTWCLKLGHMLPVKLQASKQNQIQYFLHLSVIKESSTTTKLRVVFDGRSNDSKRSVLNKSSY